MAKMTGLIKTILLKRKTAKKKKLFTEYQKHRKKAGAKAMGYAQWLKEGKEPVYYRGAGGKKKTVEAQIREAGIDPKRFMKK